MRWPTMVSTTTTSMTTTSTTGEADILHAGDLDGVDIDELDDAPPKTKSRKTTTPTPLDEDAGEGRRGGSDSSAQAPRLSSTYSIDRVS